ncbi:hypothetical protein CU098_009972 [Rhizopus stolonifer]|uniref:Uncharacterized protein n=1 Tax=Rhizopus stolonifer TaxID=4846 RepID=A0A367KGE2_RHIST|nr:hypothetical protein CU098_009972 [Rhizopus stolonifer]
MFNIPVLSHHKVLLSRDLKSPLERKKVIDNVVSNDIHHKDELNRVMDLQNSLLSMNLDKGMTIDGCSEDNNIMSNDDTDIEIQKFNEKPKKKGIQKIKNNDLEILWKTSAANKNYATSNSVLMSNYF